MITYIAAISACDKVKQPGMAMKLHRGLEPNVITYSADISACSWSSFLVWSRRDYLQSSISAFDKAKQPDTALERLCGLEPA